MQTRKNEDFRDQNFHISEFLMHLTTMIDSFALETRISQVAQQQVSSSITQGSFPKEYVNVMTTRSGKQIESYGEKDKEVEEWYDKKNVEIKENPPTPPKRRLSKR